MILEEIAISIKLKKIYIIYSIIKTITQNKHIQQLNGKTLKLKILKYLSLRFNFITLTYSTHYIIEKFLQP